MWRKEYSLAVRAFFYNGLAVNKQVHPARIPAIVQQLASPPTTNPVTAGLLPPGAPTGCQVIYKHLLHAPTDTWLVMPWQLAPQDKQCSPKEEFGNMYAPVLISAGLARFVGRTLVKLTDDIAVLPPRHAIQTFCAL